jgi:hypothetical protein
MSRQTGIRRTLVEDFQVKYFKEFPIRRGKRDTIEDAGPSVRLHFTPAAAGISFRLRERPANPGGHRSLAPQSMTGHEMDMGITLSGTTPSAELTHAGLTPILFEVPGTTIKLTLRKR